MGVKDQRVDAFIKKAADWQQPILNHIRDVVHEACPEVEEAIKWGSPSFMYKGMMCGVDAFKERVTFSFWKGQLLFGYDNPGDAFRHFGDITKIADLPSKKELTGYIRKAMELNDNGTKVPSKPRATKAKLLRTPTDLAAALKKNARAAKAFAAFSPSHKNEYIEWITEAKQDATRTKRLQTAIGWMADGKSRNWKYQ